MCFLFWLRGLRSTLSETTRSPGRPSRHHRPHLRLEVLEDRLTPSGGQLDPTFGSGGTVTLPSSTSYQVVGTAIQPDGKILTVGQIQVNQPKTGAISEVSVVRLNTDGSLDASFGSGGVVKLLAGTNAVEPSLALQPDGKILVGAQAIVNSNSGNSEYAVARLNANGTLDTTFGNSRGWWLDDPNSKADYQVEKLAVVPSGSSFSIYVGGEATGSDGHTGFVAAKLTPAGALDPSFGSGGISAVVRLGASSGANKTLGMAVTPSGEVILGGNAHPATGVPTVSGLVALDPTGHLDTGFNGTGTEFIYGAGVNPQATFQAVVVQGNDILVGGICAGSNISPQAVVARYTLTGALDPTFGTDGVYLGPGGTTTNGSGTRDIKLEADGSIALFGQAEQRSSPSSAWQTGVMVGHLSADGVADTNFGTDGTGLVMHYELAPPNLTWGPGTLAVDQAGNLVVGAGIESPGTSLYEGYVMRFTGPGNGPSAMHAAPAALIGTSNGPSMTTPSSPNVHSNGNPMSAVDQLLANFNYLLNDMRNAYQQELSSVSALQQNALAIPATPPNALLSLQAGAMGISKGTLMGDLLFDSLSSSIG
ncbi:MAG TPA: delta-60 repeat domain-containing protein [Gemmataceae bacterium]|jgi:uncharacterized delta-60 repeat protein